jgi:hypothetical protein
MSQKAAKMKMAKERLDLYGCVKYVEEKDEKKNTQKCESPRIPKNYIFPSCFIRPNMVVLTNKHGKLKGKKFQEGECLPLIESSERLRLELENLNLSPDKQLNNTEIRNLAYGRAEIINKYPTTYTRDQIFNLEETEMGKKELRQSHINNLKQFSRSINLPEKTRKRRTGDPPPPPPSRRISRTNTVTPPLLPSRTTRGPPLPSRNIITIDTISSSNETPYSGEYSTVKKNKIPKSYKGKAPIATPRQPTIPKKSDMVKKIGSELARTQKRPTPRPRSRSTMKRTTSTMISGRGKKKKKPTRKSSKKKSSEKKKNKKK